MEALGDKRGLKTTQSALNLLLRMTNRLTFTKRLSKKIYKNANVIVWMNKLIFYGRVSFNESINDINDHPCYKR